MRLHGTFTALALIAFVAGCGGSADHADPGETDLSADPHLWLEDVYGEKALDWVRAQNAVSQKELEALPEFEPTRKRLLAIYDSRERIPHVGKRGKWFYNFWRDAKNVRGVWRRTTLDEYRKAAPAWETVIDVDQLAAAENENWVWQGTHFLEPGWERCMVQLSRGGLDASVWREFDVVKKEFVAGGFAVPEAKSWVAWRDIDTIYVGTDFGPGSMTTSGYTRIGKEWKRGTPLAEARTVFEGTVDDVNADITVIHDHGRTYELASRSPTFFTDEMFVRRGDEFVRIEKPADTRLRFFGDAALFEPRTDWTVGGKTWPAGTLLSTDFDSWMRGERNLVPVFEPTARASLSSIHSTKSCLILNILENVRSRPVLLHLEKGAWKRTPLEVPEIGVVGAHGVDPDENDDYFLDVTSFLTPSSLWMGTVGKPGREKLKSLPEYFEADGLEIQQFEVKSKDGTRVPYFQVSRKGLALDGSNPTLLYGYGGFEISMLPSYNSGLGASWLERGGVYVLSNIRGGGEFGPAWHNAVRKENRQLAYDDFIAIAEDLIARKVSSPRHLGISGRSNGGLLMGAILTQRPELFRAVVCGNPLLDMKRYHKLLAGASWMDEYGDPDKPEEWAYISKFSPYQNLRKERTYPRVLFTTSTRDDRVHPGHARKMFARMQEQGHDALYYENIEGGHGSAANNKQSAFMEALAYAFLWKELK
ncbi:MAG: prolyl oligopeptidase family serine peptidase [Planctomycetota bacterium]